MALLIQYCLVLMLQCFHDLIASGKLFMWGGGELGQLGQGNVVNYDTPQPVKKLNDRAVVLQVSLGRSHTLALTVNQQVYGWGEGLWGKLGTGTDRNEHEPVPLSALNHQHVVQVAAGYSHSGACTADGHVWMWGGGVLGQLGRAGGDSLEPIVVQALLDLKIRAKSLSLGCAHTMIVTTDEQVFVWGEKQVCSAMQLAAIQTLLGLLT
jgi:alpha-tubulin suppressor-like RCC1 family protein